MPFSVLPAIDLWEGRLALLTRDGPEPSDAFGGDPIAAAEAYIAAGARWLHVVDMDLAFRGELANAEVIRSLCAGDTHVQASGGVRTASQVDALRGLGAARVVLASAALTDEDAVLEIVGRSRPGETVVGIEVADGRIRARGAAVDLELASTLGWLSAGGAEALLVTAVDRVATIGGPDTALVRRVARAGLPVMAAGGIRSLADLEAVRDAGASGAVVGRSALEGSLDLAAALAWAAV
ncbi:MAG TPA: HisA/HisF-related TIM barrel protein [Actinomycetota bacterium]|jgi:phosphoribosylformimino-5-aminoimidazole carboxamide ribotide isomerase|nr:HisA/HisF-related TIM barrel protein [Actinomycetota bacterium]